jgi:penicillin amidase
MPHSVNPEQGYLVNWNTKPDRRHYYQQNSGDEYWGTIFRSDRIAQLLQATRDATIDTLTDIEHDIGTIDHDDTVRPAAPYFVPYVLAAYEQLKLTHDPLVDDKKHPLLGPAMAELRAWDRYTALGSPAMYIFVEFMEALQRNAFGGGLNSSETYVGAVNFGNGKLTGQTFLGNATYNLLYHLLAGVKGIVPCDSQCFSDDYFAGHRDHILVESVNDAITLLSGTGPLLGNSQAKGFGNTDISTWGWVPYSNINWDNLDPLAAGVTTSMGRSPEQNRSTYMQAIELNEQPSLYNVLPPGQSGFISATGKPDAHFGDQVGLFNNFQYKPMNLD